MPVNESSRSKDPLHGIKLEAILTHLVETYGWERMANEVRINCFMNDPSIKSSLTFLRKNEWARKKVENLYLESIGHSNDRFQKPFVPLTLD